MQQQRNDRPSWIGQLLFGGIGGLIALALMLGLAGNGLSFISSDPVRALPLLQYAFFSGIILTALVPSIIYPVRRLLGKELSYRPAPRLFKYATIGLIIWPFMVLAGALFVNTAIAWLVMPVIQTYAIGVPIWWFVEWGRNKLEGGSRQRMWGILGFGLSFTPLFTIVVEILIMGALVIAFAVVGSSRPDWMNVLNRLSTLFQSNNFTPESLSQYAAPLLQLPGMVYILMALFAISGPALEEITKPIGLWFVANRKPSPEQGWVMGLVSGAAFAFWESSTTVTNMTDSGWSSVVLQRTGTGLLHVTTCGLVGLGLAYAWTERRYFRLLFLYLGAAVIHGVWNYVSIHSGLQPYLSAYDAFSNTGLDTTGIVSIVLLSLILITVLGVVNWRLRRQKAALAVQPPVEIFEENPSTPEQVVEKEE
jgi:hypothetical protein